ncbi:hypothetical protein [Streptomyces sp. TLI_105]|uniref:hypothetical protein n=1 Tax=Streptomyces sp. TLI_105 TaxID=1881019 RepID=UPI000898DE65|nr:hypothetical protein SAMN05428939_6085 [Streptomyces sp. TLI_105]
MPILPQRRGGSFEEALAGAVYGPAAVPARWTALLHVPLPGFGGRVLRTEDLRDLARALASGH